MHCVSIPTHKYLPQSGCLVMVTFLDGRGPSRPMSWDEAEQVWREADGSELAADYKYGSPTHWQVMPDSEYLAAIADRQFRAASRKAEGGAS
jgi:hypothetical protein